MKRSPPTPKSENIGRIRAPERWVTWRMVVAYRGDSFHGWQRQLGVRTVQGVLEEALRPVANADVFVRGAGRTDAGVHSRGQVASVRFKSRLQADKFILAMSARLPDDVSITHVEEAAAGFSAKTHSVAKHYRYRILARRARDPFRHDYTWHHRGPLDVVAMQRAAQDLVGQHDYESFRSTHCDALHARRHIWKLDVIDSVEGEIVIDVKGNAFCRGMVRIIAGTLLETGWGKFAPTEMPDVLAARDRDRGGVTAPAHGLTLEEVYYPDTAHLAEIPAGCTFPGWPPAPDVWPPSDDPPPPYTPLNRTREDLDPEPRLNADGDDRVG